MQNRTKTRTIATRVVLATAITLLAAVVIFAALPQSTRLMHVLHKLGHPLAFGLIAWLALSLFSRGHHSTCGAASPSTTMVSTTSYLKALGVAALLGAATELAQRFTHRGASIADVISNIVGAIAFLSFHAAFFSRHAAQSPWAKRTLISLALLMSAVALAPLAHCLAAYAKREAQFPVIAQSTSFLDRYFISQTRDNVTQAPLPARWARENEAAAFRVAIDAGEYPGIQIIEPQPDWRKYQSLAIDITNPGKTDLDMVVRVHDRLHNRQFNDRFNRIVKVTAESRTTISIPLEEVQRSPKGRLMNLQAIADLSIFSTGPVATGEFFVSRVWLE